MRSLRVTGHAAVTAVTLVSLVLAVAALNAPGQLSNIDPKMKILPVDEARRDPALQKTRSLLIEAATKHDLSVVESLADPSIRGCGWHGLGGLRSFFGSNIADYDPWVEFHKSLALGGVFQSPNKFVSNYVVWLFKDHNLEAESYSVVTQTAVPLRALPSADGQVLATLSNNIVRPIGETAKGWTKVVFDNNIAGYVESKDLAAATGLTVSLVQRSGEWRVSAIATYCQ